MQYSYRAEDFVHEGDEMVQNLGKTKSLSTKNVWKFTEQF
jgi:hypothetical protein